MPARPTFEVTFGDVSNLPDTSFLNGYDFNTHVRRDEPYSSPNISFPPQRTDIIIRRQPLFHDDIEDGQGLVLARRAVEHMKVIEDTGIDVPAQRIVYGPGYHRDRPLLYAITTAARGRRIDRKSPDDKERSFTIVEGMAAYLLWTLTKSPDPFIFCDTPFDRQYTVTPGMAPKEVIWHDTGFTIDTLDEPDFGVAANASLLGRWASTSLDEQPPTLEKLMAKLSPSLKRLSNSQRG